MEYVSVPEGLLSIVKQHVPLEVVLEAEAQAARLTHERLEPRMNHPVLQKPHLALEGLVALRALEGPVLRVRPLVDAQVAGSGETLAAGRARVWPCARVDGLVLAQAPLPDETFPTDVAHEGLHLGVRHLVVPERAGGGERAVADVALQRCFLQPVGCLVDAKLTQQPELPAALVAAQQILGVFLLSLPELVGEQVLLQCLGLVEALVAGGAGEGLDMRGDVVLKLVFLVETFVAEFAEEPLLFVQLPPPFPLLLLQLLFSLCCVEHSQCVQEYKRR